MFVSFLLIAETHPADTSFDVGQVWDLDFHPSLVITPPHVEDVIVTKEQYITQIPNLLETLMERVQPWQGNPEQLFDGLLTFAESGKGYISQLDQIPEGTLIRVSLARWWDPDGTNDKKCYLQLSGWYL